MARKVVIIELCELESQVSRSKFDGYNLSIICDILNISCLKRMEYDHDLNVLMVLEWLKLVDLIGRHMNT